MGSYLLRYLVREGYTHVRALRRPGSRMDLAAEAADRIEWLEGDLLDEAFLEEALAGVRLVYHSAAVVSFDPRDRKQMYRVNVEGTAALVNAALYREVDKLVHVSSIATLGRTREGQTLDEDNKWQRSRFNSHYAVSKFRAEQEVWRGAAEGLNAAVVNPSVILGSGRWDEGALGLYRLVWDGFPFYPRGGTGFVDVRDVARFMVRLMESDLSGQRFVLNADNWPYRQLLTGIARRLDRRPPRWPLPRLFRSAAWRWEWLRSRLTGHCPLITRETAANAARTFYFDNRRSQAALGFSYIPLEQTLSESCRQFREAAEEDFETRVLPFS